MNFVNDEEVEDLLLIRIEWFHSNQIYFLIKFSINISDKKRGICNQLPTLVYPPYSQYF